MKNFRATVASLALATALSATTVIAGDLVSDPIPDNFFSLGLMGPDGVTDFTATGLDLGPFDPFPIDEPTPLSISDEDTNFRADVFTDFFVDDRGIVEGILPTAVYDDDGEFIGYQDVPATGRVMSQTRTIATWDRVLFTNPTELESVEETRVLKRVNVRGVTRPADARWRVFIQGVESYTTVTDTDGEMTIEDGVPGFETRVGVFVDRLISAVGEDILIEDWGDTTARFIHAENLFLSGGSNPRRYQGTARVQSGRTGSTITGGQVSARADFFDTTRTRPVPGRFSASARVDRYRASSTSYLFTTISEASSAEFTPDMFDTIPRSFSFRSPAGQLTILDRYERDDLLRVASDRAED